MNEIIYRRLKKEDYEQIEQIINQRFGLYRYVNQPSQGFERLDEKELTVTRN